MCRNLIVYFLFIIYIFGYFPIFSALDQEPACTKTILPENAQEYVCRMTLINEANGKHITIPVVVDSGFMGDMELEQKDMAELDLIAIGKGKVLLAD